MRPPTLCAARPARLAALSLSLSAHPHDLASQDERQLKEAEVKRLSKQARAQGLDVTAILRDALDDDEPEWKRAADAHLDATRPVKRARDGRICFTLLPESAKFLSLPEPSRRDREVRVDVLAEGGLKHPVTGALIEPERVDVGRRFDTSTGFESPVELIVSGAIRVQNARVDPELAAIAKPHQREGIEFALANLQRDTGCILAHSMGLGKTFTGLVVADTLHRIDDKGCYTLLLAPKSVRVSWMDEIDKWGDKLRVTIHSVVDSAGLSAALRAWQLVGGILSMTYELFHQLPSREWTAAVQLVLLDEAHLLKNMDQAKYAAVNDLPCVRRVALTGTPISNHLAEYYAILSLVAPRVLERENLADMAAFKRRFIRPIRAGQTRSATTEQAKCALQHIHVLRDMMDEVMQRKTMSLLSASLPPKTEFVVRYPLDAAELAVYQQQVEPLGCFQAYQQVIGHLSVDKKVRLARTLLGALPSDESVLVFSQRKDPLNKLAALLPDCRLYTGALGDAARASLVHEFQEGQFRVLLMTAQCGSFGLVLPRASRVLLLDCAWNPAYDIQAVCRAYRYGQLRPTVVYRFIAANTVEDYCYRLQVVKTSLALNLIEEKAINRQFTTDELRHDMTSFQPTPLAGPLPFELRPLEAAGVVVSSHDGAFDEDDESLTPAERDSAANDVNLTRNATERLTTISAGLEVVASPSEKYYKNAFNDDGSPTVATTALPEQADGSYTPYVPIYHPAAEATARKVVLLAVGPQPFQQLRFAKVPAHKDDPLVWTELEAPRAPLKGFVDPRFASGTAYHSLVVKQEAFQSGERYVFSTRASVPGAPHIVSDWSDESAPIVCRS